MTLLTLVSDCKPFSTVRPFFTLKTFPLLHETRSVLYDVCSPFFKHHYIGHTAYPTRRMCEHVRESMAPKKPIHEFLNLVGAHKFALVPVCVAEDDAIEEEARLIRMVGSQLNTMKDNNSVL